MSFRAWLVHQRHRDDPVGDVARDMLADPRMAGLWGVQSILEKARSVASPDFLRSYERAAEEYLSQR